MAAWFGFSDDDLRKVKHMAKSNSDHNQNRTGDHRKKVTQGLAKKQQGRSTLPPVPQTSPTEIDPAMRLQKSPGKQINEGHSHRIAKESKEVRPEKESSVENQQEIKSSNSDTDDVIVVEGLDDKEGFDRDMMSLDKFREQQKAIEEANKQKKALLSKTITERRKRAQAETHKLEHIQKELSKLDQMLSVDVQVIRNKIEDMSREYMEAEKRFQRAEAEYIAAKVDMHQKSEQKEQLTEHMYTIIHQNEVRKAKKLADLMKEMEMECTEEDLQLPELPPLSSFQQTTLSPTGLKHIVQHQNSVETAEKRSSASDSNNPAVKVENECSSGDGKDAQKTNTELVANGQVPTASETNSVEKVSESQGGEKKGSSIVSDPCPEVDLSKVKREAVDESEQVTQVENTVLNVAEVKSEQSEEVIPKAPSKWNFDGTVT